MSTLLPSPLVPEDLRKRGLCRVTDNVAADQVLHIPGSHIVSFFRDELLFLCVKKPASAAVPSGRKARGRK